MKKLLITLLFFCVNLSVFAFDKQEPEAEPAQPQVKKAVAFIIRKKDPLSAGAVFGDGSTVLYQCIVPEPKPAVVTRVYENAAKDRKSIKPSRKITRYHCKNGCGYKYEYEIFNKKGRDAFDYHQKASCPQIPLLKCLACDSISRPANFRGRFGLERHLKRKRHIKNLNRKAHKPKFKQEDLLKMMESVCDRLPFSSK